MDSSASKVLDKARWQLMPILFAGYMFSNLDRSNIGVAAVTMNSDLGLGPLAYGIAAGMFGAGYLLFEVPSNLALNRFGARIWLARIMASWGIITVLMCFAVGPKSLVALRFILGTAEAGFLPGVLLYLTFWFPKEYRSRVTSDFMLSIPIISAVGSILSAALLGMNGVWGLRGWQWMFVVEGLPPVLLAFLIAYRLPDNPDKAKFLTSAEKRLIQAEIVRDRATRTDLRNKGLTGLIFDPLLWALGLSNFGFIVCIYAISNWLPQIAKGYGFKVFAIGIIASLPNIAGAVAMILWGYAGRHMRGPWIVLAPVIFGGAAMLIATAELSVPYIALAGFIMAGAGLYAAIPAFWTIATGISSDRRQSATGIAVVSTIGALSGVLGPPIIGFLRSISNSFQTGFLVTSTFLVLPLIFFTLYSKRLFGGVH